MSWIAVGVGAASAIGGAVISSNAASNASAAQVALGYETLNKQIAEREKVRDMSLSYAKISPAEMEAFGSMLRTRTLALQKNEQLIAEQSKVLESIDPSIREAGKQLYETLQGKSAAMLAPLERQRSLQKAKLESNLARTMGPGWRASSAGIEAMTKFDLATVDAMSQVQFQALGQLGNVLSGGVGLRNNTIGTMQGLFQSNIGMDQSILTNQDVVSKRMLNAVQGSSQVSPVDYSGVLDASKTIGQAGIGLGGAMMNVGANMLGKQMDQAFMKDLFNNRGGGGGGGGETPAPFSATGGSTSSLGLDYDFGSMMGLKP
jgi:hypothetical protein